MSYFEYGSASMHGNEKDDDMGPDVIIVTARKETVGSKGNSLSLITSTGLEAQWSGTGSILELLPSFLEKKLLESTKISMDSNLSQHQKNLIAIAIQKLSEIEPIKSEWDNFVKKRLDIDFHLAKNGEVGSDHGGIFGLNQDGSVADGSNLEIYINPIYGSQPISDQLFIITAIHELIHAFGNSSWNNRLDAKDSTWDSQLFRTAFSDNSQPSIGGINGYNQEASAAAWVGENGGTLAGTNQIGTLIGSDFSDNIISSKSGSFIIAGMGDDVIKSVIGGSFDVIVDDGGYDALVLDAATAADVQARWSANGEDLNFYVSNILESTIIGASTAGYIEVVSISGINYSPDLFIVGNNNAPLANSNYYEIFGTATDYIGMAHTVDYDGDRLRYRLISVSGEFSTEQFTVNDAGQIFANFTRTDSGSSQFTQLTVEAFDGVAASNVDVTIRWAPQGNENPEFGWMIGIAPDMLNEASLVY